MVERPIKIPGAEHPIEISPNPARVVVMVSGQVIADTVDALILREATYPVVLYIPRKDLHLGMLQRTDRKTYCPYKGDCSYYSIPIGGVKSLNAVWTYEEPYQAVSVIKDYVAFYPDRVDTMQESPREFQASL